MTTPPSPITHTTMVTYEGSSSIADAAGNLLFYTDGVTVWNQQQLVMANGTGLMGNASSAQSSLIAKQPGNSNIYYIFTTDLQGGPNGLRYSIVDMSLAAGMGSVTTKNSLLYAPCTEQLAGTLHCNGTDLWVVSHEFANSTFVAHLLTSTGVSGTTVNSSLGSSIGFLGQGIIKFSPNGKKIGMTYFNGTPSSTELFDFDNTSGIITNSLSLLSNQGNNYGCEFSPDGSKFYVSSYPYYQQWNICAGSDPAILLSQTPITTTSVQSGAMQIGPDGKIYCAKSNAGNQMLAVIANPNVAGFGCNFNAAAQSVGTGTMFFGLPNFVSSYFKQVYPFTFTVNPQISCLTASFTAPPSPTANAGCGAASSQITSYLWYLGNPAAGTANTSTLSNPVYTYPATGNYTVQLVQIGLCRSDTSWQTITIGTTNTLVIPDISAICPGQSVTLNASGSPSITWYPSGISNPSITVSPSSTTVYTVTGATNGTACPASANVTVIVTPVPTLAVNGPFSVCAGQSTTLSASGANLYNWNGTASGPNLVIAPYSNTTIPVVGTNTPGNCQASGSVSITVLPTPTLASSGNYSICAGASTVLVASGGTGYSWNTGATTSSIVVWPNVTTGYTVTGTNTLSGCNAIQTTSVIVFKCTGIQSYEAAGVARYFPNPFTNRLEIELDSPAEIFIYDLYGKCVYQAVLQKGINALSLGALSPGLYISQARTASGTYTARLLKTEH